MISGFEGLYLCVIYHSEQRSKYLLTFLVRFMTGGKSIELHVIILISKRLLVILRYCFSVFCNSSTALPVLLLNASLVS